MPHHSLLTVSRVAQCSNTEHPRVSMPSVRLVSHVFGCGAMSHGCRQLVTCRVVWCTWVYSAQKARAKTKKPCLCAVSVQHTHAAGPIRASQQGHEGDARCFVLASCTCLCRVRRRAADLALGWEGMRRAPRHARRAMESCITQLLGELPFLGRGRNDTRGCSLQL